MSIRDDKTRWSGKVRKIVILFSLNTYAKYLSIVLYLYFKTKLSSSLLIISLLVGVVFWVFVRV